MSTDLMAAHRQWSIRPADERFENLNDLYLNCLAASMTAKTENLLLGQIEAVDVDDDLKIQTPTGVLGFNNWSFGQFANRTGTNPGSVTDLPAKLAAETINYRIQRMKSVETQLYFDGHTKTVRAATSQSYGRILNHEIVAALIKLPGNWTTPPARPAKEGQPGTRIATEEDCKSSTLIKPGDTIAPAGLYGSDRDMFAFLVDPDTRIDDGTGEGLSRGFFVRNSEVGNATFQLVTFLYRYVCGNHIVWGAELVETVSIKHIGKQAKERAFDKMQKMLKSYAETSATLDTAVIKKARETELAPTLDDLVDLVTERKIMLKGDAERAYNKANEYADIDGSPRSIWGFSNGITRISQETPYADERAALDRAAGKILELAQIAAS